MELQRRDINNYCLANNITIKHWYEDAKTGTNQEREQLQQMLEDLKITHMGVIIWDIDRLTRMDLHESLELIFNIRELTNNNLILVRENINFTKGSNLDDLITLIKAFFAREWYAKIKEGQKKGIRKKIEETGEWG